MANQRDSNKKALGVYVEREDHKRLKKLAEAKNVTIADLIRMQVERLVSDVKLSESEIAQIRAEQAQFESDQQRRQTKSRSFRERMSKYTKKLTSP